MAKINSGNLQFVVEHHSLTNGGLPSLSSLESSNTPAKADSREFLIASSTLERMESAFPELVIAINRYLSQHSESISEKTDLQTKIKMAENLRELADRYPRTGGLEDLPELKKHLKDFCKLLKSSLRGESPSTVQDIIRKYVREKRVLDCIDYRLLIDMGSASDGIEKASAAISRIETMRSEIAKTRLSLEQTLRTKTAHIKSLEAEAEQLEERKKEIETPSKPAAPSRPGFEGKRVSSKTQKHTASTVSELAYISKRLNKIPNLIKAGHEEVKALEDKLNEHNTKQVPKLSKVIDVLNSRIKILNSSLDKQINCLRNAMSEPVNVVGYGSLEKRLSPFLRRFEESLVDFASISLDAGDSPLFSPPGKDRDGYFFRAALGLDEKKWQALTRNYLSWRSSVTPVDFHAFEFPDVKEYLLPIMHLCMNVFDNVYLERLVEKLGKDKSDKSAIMGFLELTKATIDRVLAENPVKKEIESAVKTKPSTGAFDLHIQGTHAFIACIFLEAGSLACKLRKSELNQDLANSNINR